MLRSLGKIIEKNPWMIIGLVLIITIAFGSLIPALEMETSTEDFMPDDEIVNANQRVSEYFGQSSEILMVFVEKQNSQNVVTSQALKEIFYVSKQLLNTSEIKDVTSIASFVDIVCSLEYSKSIENCTDKQIDNALQDLLIHSNTEDLEILKEDDSNEQNLNNFKKSADIKNCHIFKNEEDYIFEIEVYNLENVELEHAPDSANVNVTEWYISFEN
jgi:predicted RND superfamily exporter protein